MSENTPPSPLWPPNRKRKAPPDTPLNHSQPFNGSNTHSLPPSSPSPFVVQTPASHSRKPLSNLTPATNTSKRAKIYCNSYETTQTPSYKPYSLNSRGHTRQKAFAFGETTKNAGICSCGERSGDRIGRRMSQSLSSPTQILKLSLSTPLPSPPSMNSKITHTSFTGHLLQSRSSMLFKRRSQKWQVRVSRTLLIPERTNIRPRLSSVNV